MNSSYSNKVNNTIIIYDEECMICLEALTFYNSHEILISPACCGKFFHNKCVEAMKKSSDSIIRCPHCRKKRKLPILSPLPLKYSFKWSTSNIWKSQKKYVGNKVSLNEIICHEVCVVCHTQVKHRSGDQCIISLGCCGKFYHETCLNTTIEITKKSKCVNCHERFKVSTATHTSSTTSNNNSFRLWNRNNNNTTNNAMNNDLTMRPVLQRNGHIEFHLRAPPIPPSTTNTFVNFLAAAGQLQRLGRSIHRSAVSMSNFRRSTATAPSIRTTTVSDFNTNNALINNTTENTRTFFFICVICMMTTFLLCFISMSSILILIWKRQYLYTGIIVSTGIIFVSGIYSIIQQNKRMNQR